MVIVNCQKDGVQLTPHQLTIKAKLKRWYGNTKPDTLLGKVAQLKHELKVLTESLRNRTKIAERDSINKNFRKNQKQIFRGWKGKEIVVNEGPTEDEVTTFWKGIWAQSKTYNKDAVWLKTVEQEYCRDAVAKKYEITLEVMNKVLSKMS